ncbi:MAG: sodium:solute symporter [Bacteroidota bacterium]
MHWIDWSVMLAVLATIVLYGIYKTRKVNTSQSYLQGDKDLPWWTIGLSIMATQASAITFLSAPGQAYESGMGFAQFYFGMPVAMVLLCIFVLPIYYKLNVYTAYEYLEGRFDLKTRTLTAILFLIQRGMAAGLTIYAPSIILSNILNWDLNLTIVLIGAVVILYTMLGGTKAVSVTQKQQMIVILSGMFIAAMILIFQLPNDISFGDAVTLAGKMDKLEVVDFSVDPSNRYTFWTGMLGGVFLFLSYFGTDQSQVQRYLSGKSLAESRLGLLMNGIVKVPMQFLILFVGVLVFIFFQFNPAPLHFNQANLDKLEGTAYEVQQQQIEADYLNLFEQKQEAIQDLLAANETANESLITQEQTRLNGLLNQEDELRSEMDQLILQQDSDAEVNDGDYIFISFVMNYLPIGLVGLLLAVIFSAAMSSTSSELSALATTSMVDIYRRSIRREEDDQFYLRSSKLMTLAWGILALIFASLARLSDNLIELVNIVGSIFYGTILGIFVVAFFMKRIQGNAVFIAALITEVLVIALFTLERLDVIELPYLWLNLIGCLLVMLFAYLIESMNRREQHVA